MARVNIDLCFPEWTEAERQRMLEETIFSTTMAIFETGIAWFWSKNVCAVCSASAVWNIWKPHSATGRAPYC